MQLIAQRSSLPTVTACMVNYVTAVRFESHDADGQLRIYVYGQRSKLKLALTHAARMWVNAARQRSSRLRY
jgi:hypothetical protein